MTILPEKHVFISYTRDKASGQQLAEDLHTKLLNENIPVFRDVGGIDPGADWANKLEQAVRNSTVVVLVLSPKVTNSKWVRREFNLAESLGLTIIPVLAETMALPWWMTDYQLVDFSQERKWQQLIPFVKQHLLTTSVTDAPALSAPVWADSVGEDTFGIFAGLCVEGVTQRVRFIESDKHTKLWVADTTCTQALWLAVMEKNPAEFKGNLQNPVERVSWTDVQLFLSRLNQKIPELQARLLSESEWEFACRAETKTPYSLGETLSTDQANINSASTMVVKSFPANNYGLYDMHGNVWEWCEEDADHWGNQKILRGGCWALGAEAASSGSTGKSAVGNRDYTIGFRFVI